MEEEKKQPVKADASVGQENGKQDHNRRRNRHGNRRRNGDHSPAENREKGSASVVFTGKAKENSPAEKQQKNASDRNGKQKNVGKPQPASGKNNRPGNPQKKNAQKSAKRNPDRRNGQPDHFSYKDDIYGDPEEEKQLADLRARIVLKSADGLVPSIADSSKKCFPFQGKEEEPVKIPEGTDLLVSTIFSPSAPQTDGEKVEVIGVRFRSAGKVYYFDPKGYSLKKGEHVIVETARGPEFGEIMTPNSMVNASDTISPLRPLIRVATADDIAHNADNRVKEEKALEICREKITSHGLEMKLLDAQYAFDNSKLLFYFSSEGRVDFRELVKDLASVFRTRIELRQIGIRDETKMIGGIGACGRPLCCATFLSDFAQVSIKMAKEQGLSLNSTKISGVCGKLMCCLRYEASTYAEEIRRTPANDSLVRTPDGIGTVVSSVPLSGIVRVVLRDGDDKTPHSYHRDYVEVLPKEPRTNTEKKANGKTATAEESPEKAEQEANTPEKAE